MAMLDVLIITALITVVHGDDLQCNNPNEEARSVGLCPPEKTCQTRNVQMNCSPRGSELLQVKCVCKVGFVRNLGGECVSAEDCDKCFGQNQYYSCRTTPDKLCSDIEISDATDNQQESTDLNVDDNDDATNGTECKSQCYCAPGTARDENNQCVPYDQCNQPCGPGEVKDYCPTDCPTDYCPKSERSVSCPKPTPCPKPQCKCGFNTRRADNGTCISTRACRPFACKKPFEVYNPCPPLCPNGSCGQATPTGQCPAIFGRIGIVLECNPQCRCKKGYWWNEKKECVPYNQCPGKAKDTTTTTIV